jgi:heme/copper-type cytochrome/quinol oxidase subunit 2
MFDKKPKNFSLENLRIYLLLKSILNFNKKQKKMLLSTLNFNVDNNKVYKNQFLQVEKKLHKKKLEIYWTLIPALILFIIGAPSLSVLYSISELVAPELTIKAIGNQWFWTYEYSINIKSNLQIKKNNMEELINKSKILDLLNYSSNMDFKLSKDFISIFDEKSLLNLKGADEYGSDKLCAEYINSFFKAFKKQLLERCNFNDFIKYKLETIEQQNSKIKSSGKLIYESHMILEDELKRGELRLLEVDYWLILPINIEIRLLVSSVDVIHSFSVPSFGVKVDGIPGRTNEVPLFIKRKGIFYGQCSELCGVNHGFMPIVVQAMNKKSFTDILLELTGNSIA